MSGTDLKQRLAAILAADVAGYSRLMAANERATVAALDSARKVFRSRIESNQGRVIDMAGDSVLAVFETATGAVSAALAVQQELNASSSSVPEDRRMRFRIGVHLGDLIEKADGTVYGDGVNIAARLEGLAEPGGITISDAVQGAVRGKVAAGFVDQGEQQVKNIPHPVRAFAVRTEDGIAAKPSSAAGEIAPSLPDKPSIAVLPFANMSGDPELDLILHLLGRAQIGSGRHAEAENSFKRRLIRNPRSDMSRAYLASLYGSTGRVEEARRLWGELLEINPKFSIEHLRRVLPYKNPAWFERFVDGLRQAGLARGEA